MSATTRVGSAMAAGYVLGRFKKLRLALIVGSALANKNVRTSGLGLLQKGTGGLGASLGSSPEVQKLTEQVRGQLMTAGKSAAMTLAASRIDRLSDQLHERSSAMSGGSSDEEDQEQSEDQAQQGEQGDQDQQDEQDQQPEESEDQADEESEDEGEDADEEPEDQADEESDEDTDEEPEDQADEESDEDADDVPKQRSQSASKSRSTRRKRSSAPVGGA